MTMREKRKFIFDYCSKDVNVDCKKCVLNDKSHNWKKTFEDQDIDCLIINESDEEDLDRAIKLIQESKDLDKAHDVNKLGFDLPLQPTIPPMPKVKKSDNVNHPKHYQGKNECIDVMLAMFGVEAVKHFCMCNAYKYRFRSNMKNGEEDIKKAEWYEEKLIDLGGAK